MGKVIALPLSRKVESKQPQGGSAEILFFTGVRYYRLSDEDFAKLAAPVPQRRTKAKASLEKSGLAKSVMAKSVMAKSVMAKSVMAKPALARSAAPSRKLA